MSTWLVGLDGSEHSQQALAWARAVAADADRIVVAHSWEVPIVAGYEAVAPVDSVDVERAAEGFLEHAVEGVDDPRVTGRLVIGNPGRGLVDAAEELAAAGEEVTIVVGHGGSSKASLLLGSTAHFVTHHTDHAAVVVRGDVRVPVRRVVVGVDEAHHGAPDPPSVAALRWASELPGVEEIQVSHADFVPAVAAGPVREPGLESEEELAADDSELRATVAAALGGSGQPASGARILPVVGAGTGAFALIEASRDVDLVVIGSRGRSGLVELLVGATGLDVLAHSHCPVAVVR